MAYIKKLVMHGFKSFANRTEVPFEKTINVIIGPNGSGKSNVSDALCFVLGRLSVKSMRAAKASNLIFQGSKHKKPAQEASVEIVFDNSDRKFNTEKRELSIKRIVRRNGTSIYKVNSETKTRQEILEILAQAGIDPNGFNLVLQGEIARFVKMKGEERREIIEEIAGISIYENRKQRSLKEIERTEQKLKEVNAVLRERTAYLKNLEQERKQALRYKELEKTVKQCKATILKKKIDEKDSQINSVKKQIEKNQGFKEKVKKELDKLNSEIQELETKITELNKHVQKTTGFERESLSEEISELKAQIVSHQTRKENFDKKVQDNEIRKKELESDISELGKELENLKKESPKISQRQNQLNEKKQELKKVEQEREKFYSIQTELNSLKDRIRDKEKYLQTTKSESKLLYNQIESLSHEVTSQTIEDCEQKIKNLKSSILASEQKIQDLDDKKLTLEKQTSVAESEIERNKKLKYNLPDSKTCPLCRSELTPEHKKQVSNEAEYKIKKIEKRISEINSTLDKINSDIGDIKKNLQTQKITLSEKESELYKLNSIQDKKSQMKKLMDTEKQIDSELNQLQNKKLSLEKAVQERESVEDKHSKLFFEMQELSSMTDENLDTTILYKEREIENSQNVIRNIIKDQKEIKTEISRLSEELKSSEQTLKSKQEAFEELNKKFKRLYDERTQCQEKIKEKNILIVNKQNVVTRFDEAINNLKIEIAKNSAGKESLEYEIREFKGVQLIQGNIQSLEEKLQKSERELITIGNVNMRALETYDSIKSEYEKISEKVEHLQKEREEILKVIEEIDTKKKHAFLKTFKAINELFTTNFSELSSKGKAFLEIENQEDIFSGGINIAIRIAKGKYFDVTSLSGGEQTLVALSLIFAIQSYCPYSFYILDEIDAALDKKNSELLANLLKKYMKAGQYIIISHNDSIISGAEVIYGISMNDGISKVISLSVNEQN